MQVPVDKVQLVGLFVPANATPVVTGLPGHEMPTAAEPVPVIVIEPDVPLETMAELVALIVFPVALKLTTVPTPGPDKIVVPKLAAVPVVAVNALPTAALTVTVAATPLTLTATNAATALNCKIRFFICVLLVFLLKDEFA